LNVLNVVLSSLALVNYWGERSLVFWRVFLIVWSLALLAILATQRNHPRTAIAKAGFGLSMLRFIPVLWIFAHDHVGELFIRENIAVVLIAITTPPRATISLLLIVAFGLEGLILHVTGLKSTLWPWQPWTNLLYTAFASMLALYRAHRQRKEVALLVEAERGVAFRSLLRAYLAVRDSINTPLQTLQVALHLLSTKHPEAHDLTDKMQRSVERLNDLASVLEVEAKAIEWLPKDEAFDALVVLQEVKGEIRGERCES
jgi:hypothetical protein